MPGPTPTRADLPEPAEVEALVRRWLERATDDRAARAERRLADLVRDPRGLEFAVAFADRVLRPADAHAAARNLERLSRRIPRTVPSYLRVAIVLGGGFGVLVPWPVIPIVRRVFRGMVGHLVADGRPDRLARSLERLRAAGVGPDVHLLGDAVLGEHEGARRSRAVRELLARDDVDRVSVGVREVASASAPWGFATDIERIVERLLPLAQDAVRTGSATSFTLEIAGYRDLDLTVAAFTRLLDLPELRSLEAGIELPAAFPDSFAALQELTAWARRRVADGGAPIRVRIVRGADVRMEEVDAALSGWPLATWGSEAALDAGLVRMLDWALRPEHAEAVRVGVASHDLFELALALVLAERRRVRDGVELELPLGVASPVVDAVRADGGGLRISVPAADPDHPDAIIGTLIRRFEDAAGDELLATPHDADEGRLARRRDRYAASLAHLDDGPPRSPRSQDRLHPEVPRAPIPFANEPRTDPAIPANRAWVAGILDRAAASRLGLDTVAAARFDHADTARALASAAAEAGSSWGSHPAAERAEALHRAGEVLAAFRGRLAEVMVAETGMTIDRADAEVSEAVDHAHHCAELALELERLPGAEFVPSRVVLVLAPETSPVAFAAAAVLEALAAGGAPILVPEAGRCGAVLAEALWEGGIPREVLRLAVADDPVVRRTLVTAPEVDRVLLAGSFDSAELVRSWRPGVEVLGEASGANSIVVTPSADLDAAIADLVRSAFAGAGQDPVAASLAILVGSVGESDGFRSRLVDAVTSLRVGSPFDPATAVGPLVPGAVGSVASGIVRLDDGEAWLVTPRALDETDRLWSPGVRDGIRAGGTFHLAGSPAPVLGLLRARTLDEAVELQNAMPTGLVAGIHSLDVDEVARWLTRVEAGNLVVNRATTGGIVRRQPFGGWKRSTIGPRAKRGGPNALLPLGGWRRASAVPDGDLRLDGLDARVRAAVEAFQSALDYDGFAFVRHAAYDDEAAWTAEFSHGADVAGLGVERNVRRYRPAVTRVRLADGGQLADLARVVIAGIRARATIHVSAGVALPSALLPLLEELRIARVDVERDDAWVARIAAERPPRVRLVGGDPSAVRAAIGGPPDVAIWGGEVTAAGRLELLPFLLEQNVSITAHRFGIPDPAFRDLPV